LTQIDGIDVRTAATILSEAGWDMSKWKDEDHFVSWLRLCPDNRISGNKIIGKGRLPTNNRASIQARRPVAIKAVAAKLARLVCRMLRYGMKYVNRGAAFHDAQHRARQITRLMWKARELGLRVDEAPAA
jgi:transposase